MCLACGAAGGLVSMVEVERYNLRAAVVHHPMVIVGIAGEFIIRTAMLFGGMLLVSWALSRLGRRAR